MSRVQKFGADGTEGRTSIYASASPPQEEQATREPESWELPRPDSQDPRYESHVRHEGQVLHAFSSLLALASSQIGRR